MELKNEKSKFRDWASGKKRKLCRVRGIAYLEKVTKFQYNMLSFWPSYALILFQVNSYTFFDFFFSIFILQIYSCT